MVFLVLEIIIFLMLALLLGTILGYLLSRSIVRDVRTSVEQLKIDVAGNRKSLSAAETDLQLHKSSLNELRAAYDGLQERLSVHSDRQADLSGQMEGLVAARSALSERTATLASQLTEAQAGLGRQLEVAQQSLTTLESTTDTLSAEHRALAHRLGQSTGLPLPQAANADGPAFEDVGPLSERVTGLEQKVNQSVFALDGMRKQVDSLGKADAVLSSKLESVSGLPQRVNGLDESQQDLEVRLRALETLPVQVESTRGQVERMQSTTAAISSRLEHQDRWGQETEDRIEVIESRVGIDARPRPAAAPAKPIVPAAAAANDPSIPRDNLKRIRGVGVALERVLNDAGILRFQQIAAWTAQDIQRYAGLLEKKFQGRILRDDWVAQAKSLIAEDEAAANSRSADTKATEVESSAEWSA